MSTLALPKELVSVYRSGKYVPCSHFHEFSCEWRTFLRCVSMINFFAFFYGPAHVFPVLIFKLKELKKNPKHVLSHMAKNIARSVFFGCCTIGLVQYPLCILPKIFNGASHLTYFLMGVSSSLPIFIEASSRRGELALYLLPRTLESVWNIAKKFGFPLHIKKFEVFLFCLAMGVLSCFLYNNDKHIKASYKSTLRYTLGNN